MKIILESRLDFIPDTLDKEEKEHHIRKLELWGFKLVANRVVGDKYLPSRYLGEYRNPQVTLEVENFESFFRMVNKNGVAITFYGEEQDGAFVFCLLNSLPEISL